jgi:phage baseplate assembly protein W|tara:strand:- start:16519 stop:16977 length:459 start_codon:yes stop_codon:yes gene_type:complete
MANGVTYGINFPFRESFTGRYLDLSDTSDEEIRTDLVHLLLTRKGTRYFLPDFGTRLYEYIFEPLDGPTFSDIEAEIRDSVEKYIPGIQITNISITDASDGEEDKGTFINAQGEREFTVQGIAEKEHTAKIKIDYRSTDQAFESNDFVIINI